MTPGSWGQVRWNRMEYFISRISCWWNMAFVYIPYKAPITRSPYLCYFKRRVSFSKKKKNSRNHLFSGIYFSFFAKCTESYHTGLFYQRSFWLYQGHLWKGEQWTKETIKKIMLNLTNHITSTCNVYKTRWRQIIPYQIIGADHNKVALKKMFPW